MESLTAFELTREYIDGLREAIEHKDPEKIKSSVDGVNPSDLSPVFSEFEQEESAYLIRLLDIEFSAQVINNIDPDVRSELLREFSTEEITGFIQHLDSDDAVDIIAELPVKKREEVIAAIEDEEQVNHIIELMRYEEDCAGGLMAKELIKANVNWNIQHTISEIRKQAENVEKFYAVYVVDDKEYLLGRVSLRKLIMSEDNMVIKDIYQPEIVKVETYMDKREVATIMQKYDMEAVPVVNGKGKLVGRITIDDIVDVITEMAEEERQLMAGISEDVEEDDSVWVLLRARLPWLIVGLGGGILGAWFLGFFERDIVLVPAMAFFMPLITATGGNVGIQSSSIVVQTLANKSGLGFGHMERLIKVFVVALLNGIVLGLLVFLCALILGQTLKLGVIVSIALLSVIILASITGTITPILLDKLGINPAVASGPFITTANDLLGLAVYFGVAKWLLNI